MIEALYGSLIGMILVIDIAIGALIPIIWIAINTRTNAYKEFMQEETKLMHERMITERYKREKEKYLKENENE